MKTIFPLLAATLTLSAADNPWPPAPSAARTAEFIASLAANPEQRAARLVEAIKGSDAVLKRGAFGEARRHGDARQLAEALPGLPPADQVIVLDILRDKVDLSLRERRNNDDALSRSERTTICAAVEKLAASPNEEVRLAALAALGTVGNASHLDLLLKSGSRESLERLRGPEINPALMARAKSGDPAERAECLTALVARGATGITSLLMSAADDAEPRVQQAAFAGLRILAGPAEASELLRCLRAAKPGPTRRGWQDTLVTAARRDDSGTIASSVVAASKNETDAARALFIEVLGGIGGEESLACLKDGLKSPEADVRAASVRALSNWSDIAPVENLIAFAGATDDAKCRVLALRGVARLVRQEKNLAPARAARILNRAIEAAAGTSELEALKTLKSQIESGKPPAGKASAARQPAAREFKEEVKRLFTFPHNLALGATATNPDGLANDGAGQPPFAAVDGDPNTYWDEVDGQKLYQIRVQLKQRATVSRLCILGYTHHGYSPKDFEVLCDDKPVKKVVGAEYDDALLTVDLPPTECQSVQLNITGCYGKSPAIRELGIYGTTKPERSK
jgi:HEAT repeat protein